MPRTKQNFTLYAGDSRTIEFELAPDTPDLAGGGARWWLGTSENASGDAVKLKKSTDSGQGAAIVLDTATGLYKIIIVLLKTDTDLPAGEYFHEAQVDEVNGKSHTVSTGKVTVRGTMR